MSAPAVQSRRPPLRRLLAGPTGTLARGSQRGTTPNIKRIAVSLDAATFDRIAMLAAASRVTMAEALRQLISAGLDSHSD
jgi:hypothetical protein